jgi:hypothetical protein
MKLYFLLVFKKTTILTLKVPVVHLPAYALYNCKTLSLKQRYQEHTGYVKQNDLQSAYALNVLNNKYEYGFINNIISLLK